MDLRCEYKKQTDAFCDNACKIGGEEMLRRIRDDVSAGEEEPTGRIRVKHTGKIVIFIAACFAALSMTLTVAAGAAGYGPLADLFRQIFHDETTAQIVEEGCLYEVGKTVSDGIFQTNFIAVTGDEQTPKLLLDIYVNDDTIAAENDIIGVCAYTLGVQQYENELDQYGTCDALAYRDENNPNLYHASIVGASAWVNFGEEFVLDVSRIILDIDEKVTEQDKLQSNLPGYDLHHFLYEEPYTIEETHMEFRLTIPSGIFHDIQYCDFDPMIFSCNGIDYQLFYAEYGAYRTDLYFRFVHEGSGLTAGMTDYREIEETLQKAWIEFVSGLVLTVDGKDYVLSEENRGYVWYDTEGESGEKHLSYVSPSFPAIDYANAQSVTLSFGNETFTLK